MNIPVSAASVNNDHSTTLEVSSSSFFDFAEQNKFALVKVHSGAKNPVGNEWQNHSSKDRKDWEQWAKDGFNIGVHAGASRLIIFDLDSKHGGIEAVRKRFDDWCVANGMAPLPHHVETPSKGQHVFMRVPDGDDAAALASDFTGKIGRGVEILTGDRQSVAPGSFFAGDRDNQKPSGHYTFNPAAAMYEAPQAVLDICKPVPRKPRDTVTKIGTLDFEDTKRLYKWLAENGVIQTDKEWHAVGMAARLEFGDAGFELWNTVAQTLWNEPVDAKNVTRWNSFKTEPTGNDTTMDSIFDLAHKAGWKSSVRTSHITLFPPNVIAAQAAIDAAKATASPSIVPDQAQQLIPADTPVPGGPNVAPREPVEYEPAGGLMQKLGDRLKDFALPDYLWDGILLKRFCYSMTAQTGTGKTALALLIAAHVATGQSLCGLEIEKGQVIYMAGENPIDVDMRFLGLCKVMGLDPDALEIAVIPFAGPLSKYADTIRSECETRNVKPALVIVDTAAAYFDGKEGNSNEEQGDYARSLRALTTLPGEPCILVLAHPTKGAKDINEMVPRGGSAFLNEMDGNIGVARGEGGLIGAQAIGKFRGPEFTPLHFALHGIRDVPALYDAKKGKFRPTVVAQPVSEAGAAAVGMESETDDIRLLRDIDAHPRDAHRDRAPRLGCSHTTIGRRIEKLAGRKLVDASGLIVRLTPKGQRELNDLESMHQSAPSNVQFPVPAKG
jgi:hypothetical protein